MKTIPHPRTTDYQQIYTAISKQRVPNSCLNIFGGQKLGEFSQTVGSGLGCMYVEPPNCVVFQEQIRFVRLNFRCITEDETEIYTHFFRWGYRAAIPKGRNFQLLPLQPIGSGLGCWPRECSGVARLEEALVQGFQQGPRSTPHRVSLSRLPTAMDPRALHALHNLLLRAQ